MASYYKLVTAIAPVNIAVIKYWGKKDETLKIPINDSLSGTLNVREMHTITSIAISNTFQDDEFLLNGKRQDFSSNSNVRILLDGIKQLSRLETRILAYKVHIVSYNNFPTAAGLASSASGYACLAYVLGEIYGIIDKHILSKLARRGSGSACRSLFGGFVEWQMGEDHDSSRSLQVVPHTHWPEMRVIICVVSNNQKDVSSSEGMARSVKSSQLIRDRAQNVVPQRMIAMKQAILRKDFETFANLTMQDSNHFHAICLDTYPPIFYLNDTSRLIIKLCSNINAHYGHNKVAYTFDAGPNACIYLLNDFVDLFIGILQEFFPLETESGCRIALPVKGKTPGSFINKEYNSTLGALKAGFETKPNSINYLINTSIGGGPKLVKEHLKDDILKP